MEGYRFIHPMPKADLHVHLEGTMEAEWIFRIAQRNRIAIPYPDIDSLRRAYKFEHLADFLSVYYQGTKVLRKPEDFYDITKAYLERAAVDNTFHSDIFIDPQAHLDKGISLEMILEGVLPAISESGEKHGSSAGLILCFLRHRPLEESLEILRNIGTLQEHFEAVGLAANELGHPPIAFKPLYELADEMGFKTTIHAGEEGPVEYVRQAIQELSVDRIDHGNSIIHDAHLMAEVRDSGIPLTMCPLSNLQLQVIDTLCEHPADSLLKAGLKVTINSDDPAYFDGYMDANLNAMVEAFGWEQKEIVRVIRHSFEAAFATETRRAELQLLLDSFLSETSLS